jgi:hypothetical protein
MGKACSTYVYKILVGESEGKRPLGRPKHRCENNIEMNPKGVRVGGCELNSCGSEYG